MASTYTAAGIELIAQGEQAGAWGDTTNTNWALVEEMIGGVVSVALTTTSETLTTSDGASSDGRHAVIVFTGSPGGTCTVTVSPNDMQKVYFIVNNSDETVTLSQGSGANVNVAASKTKIVYCDGAGAGAAVTDISSGFDATTLAELGVTASAAELNTLDGITADVNELNLNDGASAGTIANSKTVVYGASGEVNATTLQLGGTSLTASATELNYVDGVTSSIQTQLDAMVEKAGDTMTGLLTLSADPSSALHAATKQYVDTQTSAGIHYHDPVRGEVSDSEGNLNATYNNGTAGVGATLTNAGANAAFNYGGISDWSTTERVLIYSQTDQTENGVYTVTTVGDGSTPWVLTRATDADSAGASDPDALGTGDAFFVQEGNGAGELYVMNTEGTITFGTTNITFTQIASAAIYSAGSGLDLNGTVFSHTDTSSQASVNNSGNTFIQDVTLDGFGHVTALTSATAVINDGTLTLATSGTGLSGSASFTANDSDNVTFTVTSNATNANTASTIVARDASGNFSAGTITAALSGNASTSSSCSGNAATATAWATGRTLTLSGDVSGTSSTIDGTGNITLTATVADDSHNHVISNVDGLQTALDAKAAIAGQTFTGAVYFGANNFGGDSGDYLKFTADTQLDIYINASNEFRFEADGDFHADGDVIAYSTTTASDERLKENIQVVEGAVDKCMALRGVTFDWKRDGAASAGVIAQDVQEVLPEAVKQVTGMNGEDHLTVNYGALTSILIEAIKELKAEIEVLKGAK